MISETKKYYVLNSSDRLIYTYSQILSIPILIVFIQKKNHVSTLNSNKISYSEEDVTIMGVYTNLNDYTTPKIYRTYVMADASTSFENCPITCKFVLLVQKFNTTTYQTIYPMDLSVNAHIYKRSLFEDVWSDWIVLG